MKALSYVFNMAGKSIISGLFANLALSLILGISLKQMWKLFGTLQIITHIPLMNIPLPSNVGVCISSLIDLINLKILPDSVTDTVFD